MIQFIGRLFLTLVLTAALVFAGLFIFTDDVTEALASDNITFFADGNDDNDDPYDPETPPPDPEGPIPCPLPPEGNDD